MENQNPNQQQAQPAGGAAPEGQPQGAQQQLDPMEALKQKKGWKSNEEVVRFAEETEKSFSRQQNITNKVKQQLESAGYTIDDEGNVKTKEPAQPSGYPPQGQSGQYPPQGQPQETIYDPYTGIPITDPLSLQLARMPVGQREAFIVNAMLDQREKQSQMAFQADQEVLTKPEAKGFEEDVRKVMQALPLAQRADKKSWEDALLRVKGMRYDQAMKNAGQQGVEQFLNKEGIQMPTGSGGDGSGASLNSEQEQAFQWYAKNQPGLFKDRAHFLRMNNPTGGR
jgi:hypothetical protein